MPTADPAQYFRRWRDRLRLIPRRIVAELLFKLMSCPARLVTALLSDVSEHCMPCVSLRLAVSRLGFAVSNFGKLAVGEQNGFGSALRQKPAMCACLSTLTQCTALATFEQFGEHGHASACVRRVLGPLGNVESPFDRILEEPMPIHRASMVDQNEVLLPEMAVVLDLPSVGKGLAVWSVGRAQCIRSPDRSNPSVSTMQLETTSVSPDASRARIASRSSFGVVPSTCSARTPAFTNSSRMCSE